MFFEEDSILDKTITSIIDEDDENCCNFTRIFTLCVTVALVTVGFLCRCLKPRIFHGMIGKNFRFHFIRGRGVDIQIQSSPKLIKSVRIISLFVTVLFKCTYDILNNICFSRRRHW